MVNGVFKGGGAKGAAYAGALEAVAAHGIWFDAVAGASAGAITAALIAAGLPPTKLPPAPLRTGQGTVREPTETFASASTTGLATVSMGLRHAVLGVRDSLFDAEGLHAWMAGILRDQCGPVDGDPPVTFKELFECSDIELFVIAMDLSSKAPVVFHHATTPDAVVASAVVASCAIPGAFPSGRMAVDAGGYRLIDQLVDGGSWANFPQFVFADRQFRAWLKERVVGFDTDVRTGLRSNPTLGFVLDDDLRREPPVVVRVLDPRASRRVSEFDRGSAVSSGSTAQYAVAKILGTTAGRLGLLVVVGVWLTLTFAAFPEATRRWTARLIAADTPMWPLAEFVAVTSVLLAALLTGSFVIIAAIFGRTLSKTVVPSAAAALGVATGTPPWIGQRTDNIVVLSVPAKGLTTLSFKADASILDRVNEVARWRVAGDLSDALDHGCLTWQAPFDIVPLDTVRSKWREPPADAAPEKANDTNGQQGTSAAISVLLALVATACLGFSLYLLERSSYARALTRMQSVLLSASLLVAAFVCVRVSRGMHHHRLLIRIVGFFIGVFGIVFLASGMQTFRKARYFAEASGIAVGGVMVVVVLLARGAAKAHERANDRRTPTWSGRVLISLGLVVIGAALVAVFAIGEHARNETRPSVLISARAVPRGVVEVFCLDPHPSLKRTCAEPVTLHAQESTYRIGEPVLLRRTPQSADGYQVIIAPEEIPLRAVTVALLVGIGCVLSGLKHRAFRNRRAVEQA